VTGWWFGTFFIFPYIDILGITIITIVYDTYYLVGGDWNHGMDYDFPY
jgi:hypothetical protein